MNISLVRRGTACVAGIALAGSALAVATPSAQADPGTPTGRTAVASTWLSGQLTNGVVVSGYYSTPGNVWTTYTDLGLSADIAFAQAVLGNSSAVRTISDAVAGQVADWYDSFGTIYTGSIGKAAVLAQTAGANPRAYGGKDLITLLESYTANAAPIAGRIENQGETDWSTSEPTDSANVLGQIFAARALTQAGSPEAPAALSYLLQQQCAGGFFRQNLTAGKTAPSQGCTSADASSTDTTTLAVLQLEPLAAKPGVKAALAKAGAWLAKTQSAGGGFADASSTAVANANSTGLAGWAMGTLGLSTPAAKAASWVASRQLGTLSPCTGTVSAPAGGLGVDRGGIAFDDLTLGYARSDNAIERGDRGTWVRATAQAAPALRYQGAAVRASGATVVARSRTASIMVSGLNAGDSVCVKRPGQSDVVVSGAGQHRVTFKAKKAGVNTLSVTGFGRSTQVKLTSVKAKKLPLAVGKARVRKPFTVKVSGLVAREPVTIRVKSKVVARGVASARGVFKVRVVIKKRGKATVVVKAGLASRKATKVITVKR